MIEREIKRERERLEKREKYWIDTQREGERERERNKKN